MTDEYTIEGKGLHFAKAYVNAFIENDDYEYEVDVTVRKIE